MFIVAKSHRFKLVLDTPSSHREAGSQERTGPDRQRRRMGGSSNSRCPPSFAIPDYCLHRWASIRRIAQAGMVRRGYAAAGIHLNGQTRVVPLTPDGLDTFMALHRECRLDTPKVFLYKGKPWKNPRTAFTAACRRAGIIGLRLHDLRHTASTNLRRAGVDTMTAMKIVGHKSEQMHRWYNTIQPEDLHETAAKLQN